MMKLISFLIFGLISSLGQISGESVSYEQIFEQANAVNDFLLETRRYIHQHPELANKEYGTSKKVQEALDKYNISYTTNWGTGATTPGNQGTGIVAQVGTGHAPCVALRGDMDALPIYELADVPFKSQNDGVMHACGHDVHTTMLLGAAIILKQNEQNFNGTVRFLFQPAEEGGGGAEMMVQQGAMSQYPKVDRVFGHHVMSVYPSNTIWANGYCMHAGVNSFHIDVIGKGGHAASHHLTKDPITAAMAIVRSLYDVYAREMYFQPEYAGLITVAYVDAGTSATNVIPDTASLGGTLRALKTNTLEYLMKRVKEVAEEVTSAYKCDVKMTFGGTLYPSVENDPEVFKFFQETASVAAVDGYIHVPEPMMGSEDYSFFACQAPSVFYHIGSGSGTNPKSDEPHHNALFAVDESVIPQGSSLAAYLAMKSIDQLNAQASANEYAANDEGKDEL